MSRNPSDTKHSSGVINHAEKREAAKAKRSHKPKTTDKAQSERFIEAARGLGVEKTGETFEQTFAKVVRPKSLT
jgi:hypothetical protein